MTRTRSPLAPLKDLKVSSIDVEDARRHFDLPVEDRFEDVRAMRSAFNRTKAEFIYLFRGRGTIDVYRALTDLDDGWADELVDGSQVGASWSFDPVGALRATQLDQGGEGLLLHGSVALSDVDWATTVAVNTFHEEEREILLRDDARISLHLVAALPDRSPVRVMDPPLDVGPGRPWLEDGRENEHLPAPEFA